MANKSYWHERTSEEIAFDKLCHRFIKSSYRLKKRETLDHSCPKCDYTSLVRATYQNDDRKRIVVTCLHCGYENDPIEVKQLRMF